MCQRRHAPSLATGASRGYLHPMRILLTALIALTLTAGGNRSHAQNPSPAPIPGKSVVVLELYTSQGCSSCPPADKVLSDFGQDPQLRDKVIPLAFHVDYWDYIGWDDPFASPRWSERQRRYGKRAFDTRRIYTPQLVINGKEHLVGSNRSGARSRIDAASGFAALASVSGQAKTTKGRIDVDATIRIEHATDQLDVLLVLYENDVKTRVTRGENTGRTLTNNFIVRRLSRVSSIDGKKGTTTQIKSSVEVEPDWNQDNLGVVLLVQNPETMAIAGAQRLSL
jgi:hypothetical protein